MSRIRFTRKQIIKAFRKGYLRASPIQMSIGFDPYYDDSLEQLCKEMDKELGDILEKNVNKFKSEGENCLKCGNFFPQAESNQENNKFICYSCRKYG